MRHDVPHDPLFSDEPPPPAYSDQEFDRKVSIAVEESLNAPAPAPVSQPSYDSDETFEEWNDEEYERAAAALRQNDGWTGGSFAAAGIGASSFFFFLSVSYLDALFFFFILCPF